MLRLWGKLQDQRQNDKIRIAQGCRLDDRLQYRYNGGQRRKTDEPQNQKALNAAYGEFSNYYVTLINVPLAMAKRIRICDDAGGVFLLRNR